MRKYCSFFAQKKQADDLIFPLKKKINKYSYKFVYQSILKKTTVHENRKTEDNFVLKVLMVFLILIVVSFVFRNSILQQAIEKASTKIEQKYNSDL
jgi:hypothetical protein